MSNESCSACGTQVAAYDGVLLSAKEGSRLLCSRCYNETIAEYLGLDYEHVAFEPVTLENLDGIPHTFQFRTREQIHCTRDVIAPGRSSAYLAG